ncbi:MAG: hypothetical protein ACFFDN_33505 [Candidatus Hodarchaeota archaeon]
MTSFRRPLTISGPPGLGDGCHDLRRGSISTGPAIVDSGCGDNCREIMKLKIRIIGDNL